MKECVKMIDDDRDQINRTFIIRFRNNSNSSGCCWSIEFNVKTETAIVSIVGGVFIGLFTASTAAVHFFGYIIRDNLSLLYTSYYLLSFVSLFFVFGRVIQFQWKRLKSKMYMNILSSWLFFFDIFSLQSVNYGWIYWIKELLPHSIYLVYSSHTDWCYSDGNPQHVYTVKFLWIVYKQNRAGKYVVIGLKNADIYVYIFSVEYHLFIYFIRCLVFRAVLFGGKKRNKNQNSTQTIGDF